MIYGLGKARIIMGLPRLRNLARADYLCDALGWIDYLEAFLRYELKPRKESGLTIGHPQKPV